MANTLGIPEATLLEIIEAGYALNLRTARPHALGTGGPLVVRISDHADNDAAEVGTDTDKMAIFSSKAFGHPWVKDTGLTHSVGHGAGAYSVKNTVIFPDYDYATFE